MSNKPHQKAEICQGEKRWEVLRGLTNKFQAQQFKHPASEGQPQRKDWLRDGGGMKILVPSSLQHHPLPFLRRLVRLQGEQQQQQQQQQQLRMLTLLQQR